MQEQNKDEIVYLYLDDIIPNRFQPREVFDEKALKELAISIKEHGVIQPIIVRNVNGKYEIIAGERRYKASAMAGLRKSTKKKFKSNRRSKNVSKNIRIRSDDARRISKNNGKKSICCCKQNKIIRIIR